MDGPTPTSGCAQNSIGMVYRPELKLLRLARRCLAPTQPSARRFFLQEPGRKPLRVAGKDPIDLNLNQVLVLSFQTDTS